MSQIFMGSPTTFQDILQIRVDLERALTLIGGLQQPAHSPNEEIAALNERFHAEGVEELEGLARSIYHRLTGNEIEDA